MATGMLADFSKNNPFAGLSQKTYTPETSQLDANTETVQGQVNNLISADNPLMQKARANAQMQANSRGLLNSSLAAGAGTSAMLDAALPIASADAQTYSNRSMFNTTSKNDANKFNADWNNQLMTTGANIASQWGLNESNQNFQTSERLGSQSFTADQTKATQNFQAAQAQLDRAQQTALADKSIEAQQALQAAQQNFQSAQAALDRTQQTALQERQQNFQSGQNALDRTQQLNVLSKQQGFQATQAELDRAQQILLSDKNITAQQALQKAQQEFQSGQNALDRTQQTTMQSTQIQAQKDLQSSQQTFQSAQSALDRSLQTNLATMSKETQTTIATMNKDYAQLSQLSSTASTLYNNFSSAAQAVLTSDLAPEAKETAINQMATLMTGGMQIQGSILGDVDMTTLVGQIFGSVPVPTPTPSPATAPAPAPANPQTPTTVGDTTLPQGFSGYTPQQKVAFFNQNGVGEADLRAAGVPQADIDYMKSIGYTGFVPAGDGLVEDPNPTFVQ